MEPKISFGVDYLMIMRTLQLTGAAKKFDPVADAASQLFLIQWGLSPEEADQASDIVIDKMRKDSLPDFKVVFERLVGHLRAKGPDSAERLLLQVAAIASLDFDVTADEASFVGIFQNYLDLRPSEWEALTRQGANWALALHHFGGTYAKQHGS